MKQLIVKYHGQCTKCGKDLEIGMDAMYEKSMGIFCVGCGPKDVEEIRYYRQIKADRKADKYTSWAAKRRATAEAALKRTEHFTGDHAFNTQPGHIPGRARIIKQEDRALKELNTAKRFEEKADSLRHVTVKGDAERRRERQREALDKILCKGSRVHDFVFGDGEIVGVYKKSYRIKFDRGFTYARDKSYVSPLAEERRIK